MEQSILKSTKKMLNIDPDDTAFDLDVMTNINDAFFTLRQLGVGPEAGFMIEDAEVVWADFLPEEEHASLLNAVKSNIWLKVRYHFDPPQTNHVMVAMEKQLAESDWRISVMREENEWVTPLPDDFLVVDGGDPSGEL